MSGDRDVSEAPAPAPGQEQEPGREIPDERAPSPPPTAMRPTAATTRRSLFRR